MISDALDSLMFQPSTRTAAVTRRGAAAAEDIEAAVPHAVYFVRADDVAEGRLLAAAVLSGWRYILLAGDRAILAAELSFDRESGGLEFSHTNDGPLVSGTVNGVRVAEGLQEVGESDFELRLLEIPGLSVAALWLHASDRDLLMPVPPTRRRLKPFAVYTEEALLTAIGAAPADGSQIKGAGARATTSDPNGSVVPHGSGVTPEAGSAGSIPTRSCAELTARGAEDGGILGPRRRRRS